MTDIDTAVKNISITTNTSVTKSPVNKTCVQGEELEEGTDNIQCVLPLTSIIMLLHSFAKAR